MSRVPGWTIFSFDGRTERDRPTLQQRLHRVPAGADADEQRVLTSIAALLNPTQPPAVSARHHGPASASVSAPGLAPLPGVDRAPGNDRVLAGRGEQLAAVGRRGLRHGAVILGIFLGACKGSGDGGRLAFVVVPVLFVVAGALFMASFGRNVQR